MKLTGKVCIVSGSAKGIGKAIARKFGREGATVVINSVTSSKEGKEVAATIGNGSIYVRADCSTEEGCTHLVSSCVKRFGRLDILVANHGINKVVAHTDLDGIDATFLQRVFQTNVFGVFWLIRAAMPHLRLSSAPSVLIVSSIAGIRPVGSSIAYAMTKAAVNHLTVLLAKSFGPVTVNALAPGLVRTELASKFDESFFESYASIARES